jgi:spermidine synthase
MSVLHRSERDGRVVEVRGAGQTRRLYVDGVFHSAWNPSRPLTGAIWDHLALPSFFVRPEGARSALVLGVGGGTVVRMLADLTTPERLVGVELDAELLEIGHEWFGLAESGAGLHRADAARWVEDHAGERFELIVDDLFGEDDGEPLRPVGLDDAAWWMRLADMLTPGGVLVVNHVFEDDLFDSDLCQDDAFVERFPAAVYFTCDTYANAACALMTTPISLQSFRARLAAHPALATAAAKRLQRFRIRELWTN